MDSLMISISLMVTLLVFGGVFIGSPWRKRRSAAPKESKHKESTAGSNWDSALQKTRAPFLTRLADTLRDAATGTRWDANSPIWERLEEVLLGADIGPGPSERLLKLLKQDFHNTPSVDSLKMHLRDHMEAALSARAYIEQPVSDRPRVTVLVGVNGAGKTTTAGKLAALAKSEGKTVVLGAGDTFRAAAVEQLKTWADRIGVECVVPAAGANPAAVAFDAVAAGVSRGADEVILDTAGRLHTKDNLMEELKKVIRVIAKKLPGAPHRVFLVLDATLGQNAVAQAKEFCTAIPVTGIVLTKLDGSARGGAVFQITSDLGVPVALAGIGEKAEDLRLFSAQEFVRHLIP